ncbi:hypothetical protein ZWY2020_003547 [Hordeum vulgare]|nr:hypothetical protein ZWY2020_003547 [Hordeum vulgare]
MSAEEVKEDIRKIKEDEKLKFAAQDPSFTGKGAKVVFRDKEGKRINQEDIQKAKKDEKPKIRHLLDMREIRLVETISLIRKHIEWGKGLVQKRAAEARVEELEKEKDQPFARTRDDPELDSMLKNRLEGVILWLILSS